MGFLRLLNEIALAIIIIVLTVIRVGAGLIIIAGCVAFVSRFHVPSVLWPVVGLFVFLGFIAIVTALGPFITDPDPDREAARETRKALRRARMLRRW